MQLTILSSTNRERLNSAYNLACRLRDEPGLLQANFIDPAEVISRVCDLLSAFKADVEEQEKQRAAS